MRHITELEFSLIESKVVKCAEKIGIDDKSTSFLHMMLDSLFPRSSEEISSLITDGGNDRGADGVYIQESGSNIHVTLVQAKYSSSIKVANRNFPGGEIDKIISLIRDIADRSEALLLHVNNLLKSKIIDIWRLIDSGKIIHIHVLLVSNGLPLAQHERSRADSFCAQYDFVTLEELNYQGVINLLSNESRKQSDGVLDTVDVQKYERVDCDIRGLVANVDATSFIKMISDDGRSIKRHLFDENIRGFLGLDGGYNRQIHASALSDENHLFWYLNNGITIIAKEFTHQRVRGSKIHLKDFQIVNGAQTSYSLFEAFKRDPEKVSDVVLLVKIFASSRSDIAEQIAIATNSQARIAPRDLKANDAIQKKIASIFEDNGLLYERKKNQFENDDSRQRIDSLKLGQALLAYKLHEPHLAKTQSDEIFGSMYNAIFSEKLGANYLIKLSRLYLFVNSVRETELVDLRRSESFENSNEFIAYTQWYIMYCISLLAGEDSIDVPEEQDFDGYFERARGVISGIAERYRDQSFYRVFRSAKTKELIMNELGIGQLRFSFEN
ncbi:AIPR family protein [Agrobacterium rubi]|uniref:AIPR family protein n=1 Tax=Agrobacterium rubi TaxID=28099 RepID=UPI001571A58D|nr:AIPR family protein [Agrobacterium rubi]NTF07095.1 AIPR family protein [Agrobacterium rubi]NTF19336.1 AIPR family protein [Agrobacterium rubi]NTF26299.1 AIPR family protein [Agrobacterium rubi]